MPFCRPTICGLLAAVLLISTLGCQPTSDSSPDATAQDRGDLQPPNVVIMLIDTLRADRLNCYGYEDRRTSPNIDALAAESVLFEQAYTPAPWTLPSVVSIMTSTYVCEHNVLVDGQKISPDLIPLAERLKSAGYATATWFANPYAGPLSGLGRGFDFVAMRHNGASTNSSHIIPWIERLDDEVPFYVYIHNTEPHDPWRVPPEFCQALGGDVAPRVRQAIEDLSNAYRNATRVDFMKRTPLGTTDNTETQRQLLDRLFQLRDPYSYLYDASVRHADYHVGDVVSYLKDEGLWDNTLFMLIADHGEELGEHGGWQHDQSVYEELVRTPLLIKFPNGRHAGTRRTDVVTLLDLLPTIASILGQPQVARDARGADLLPLITGDLSPADLRPSPFTVTSVRHNRKKYFKPYKQQRGDINVALRLEDWKAIWNVEPETLELYNLATDPAEQNNVAAQNAELARSLAMAAQRFYEGCVSGAFEATGDLSSASADELANLRALGYVGDDVESEPAPATGPADGDRSDN